MRNEDFDRVMEGLQEALADTHGEFVPGLRIHLAPHKGYAASVPQDLNRRAYVGRLDGVDEAICFEGKNSSELTAAFHMAVAGHLAGKP